MPLVETKRTICTDLELTRALIKAWQKLYRHVPKKESVYIIMSQHMLETGSNQTWNWNLANVKYIDANSGANYVALAGVWEVIGGIRKDLTKDDPGSRFRAFATLDEGSEFYLQFLSNGRYKKAWQDVINGDPAAFVKNLRLAGFFTAPESDYLKAELFYFNKYMKSSNYEQAIKDLSTSTPEPIVDQPIIHPDTILPTVEDKEIPDDGPLQLTKWQKIVDFFTGWTKK